MRTWCFWMLETHARDAPTAPTAAMHARCQVGSYLRLGFDASKYPRYLEAKRKQSKQLLRWWKESMNDQNFRKVTWTMKRPACFLFNCLESFGKNRTTATVRNASILRDTPSTSIPRFWCRSLYPRRPRFFPPAAVDRLLFFILLRISYQRYLLGQFLSRTSCTSSFFFRRSRGLLCWQIVLDA